MEKERSAERLLASCEGLVSDKKHFQGKEWKLSQVRQPVQLSYSVAILIHRLLSNCAGSLSIVCLFA